MKFFSYISDWATARSRLLKKIWKKYLWFGGIFEKPHKENTPWCVFSIIIRFYSELKWDSQISQCIQWGQTFRVWLGMGCVRLHLWSQAQLEGTASASTDLHVSNNVQQSHCFPLTAAVRAVAFSSINTPPLSEAIIQSYWWFRHTSAIHLSPAFSPRPHFVVSSLDVLCGLPWSKQFHAN